MRSQEDDVLATAVAVAEISGLCGCGQSDCFTFSTRSSRETEVHDTIIVEGAPAFVTLDVSSERQLLGVEILGWGDLHPSYLEFCERVRTWRP